MLAESTSVQPHAHVLESLSSKRLLNRPRQDAAERVVRRRAARSDSGVPPQPAFGSEPRCFVCSEETSRWTSLCPAGGEQLLRGPQPAAKETPAEQEVIVANGQEKVASDKIRDKLKSKTCQAVISVPQRSVVI